MFHANVCCSYSCFVCTHIMMSWFWIGCDGVCFGGLWLLVLGGVLGGLCGMSVRVIVFGRIEFGVTGWHVSIVGVVVVVVNV
jgi:hypothetical protein